MTHISGHTSRQSLSRHLHQSPPCHHREQLELHSPPQPSCIHLDRLNLHLANHYVQHSYKLPGSYRALPVGNYEQKGKNSFFFFPFHVFIYLFPAWALSHLLWQMIHSLLCELLKSLSRVWNLNKAIRRPSATPEHKILLVVCAFIHRVSQATLANIWATFLCVLRMCVCLCGIVHVLILPHFDILHNGGSSLNMLMASMRYDSVTVWINISSPCNIAISPCRLCGLVTQLKTS